MQAVSRQELARIIGERTLDVQDRSRLARSIAAYLTESGNKLDLDVLLRDVMQYRLERGIVEATVFSAAELPPTVMTDIQTLLKQRFPDAKRIVLAPKFDERLVGGIRIELPQENLDLSVRSKLNLLKRLVAERN